MASSLWLAMDMDKTLVFYDNQPIPSDVQLLPASSGTGRVGFVGKETLNLLVALEAVLPNLMCVSGQRAETMYQRQPFFPSIKVWICENGGRAFHTTKSGGLEEDNSFVERLFASVNPTIAYTEAVEKLSTLRAALLGLGFEVDSGFKCMLRVKLPSLGEEGAANRVIAQLPTQFLSYTFNLGYLDVTLRGITKASAIAAVVAATEERHGSSQFIFMGDDDNDICAADAATEVYVSNPCSVSMGRWLDHQKNKMSTSLETNDSSCLVFANENERGLPRLVAVPATHLQGHLGSAALLRLIFQRVSQ